MAIIPKGVEVKVAKKYPGNAEHAQDELIALAVQGAQQGKCVVRLKQGDPFLYGRGGEEFLAFKKAGHPCTIIPGISSALAAPLLAGIPVTQRGVADTLVVCTAVGKGGKGGVLVGYERGRSVSILMGVARLAEVVRALVTGSSIDGKDGTKDPTPTPSRMASATVVASASLPTPITPSIPSTSAVPVLSASTLSTTKPPSLSTAIPASTSSSSPTSIPPTPISSPLTLSGLTYPPYTPIAIIERGSSPDQRLVASTLSNIVSALERSGGQRPPGMILVGWAVLALGGNGELGVLEDGEGKKEDVERRDRERVGRWLGGKDYVVREGLADGWEAFDGLGAFPPII